MIKKRTKWTKERCIAEAQGYSSRNAFKKGSARAYYAIHKNGWQEECFAHMSLLRDFWTKDRCIAEAQKYKTPTDFSKGSPGAYMAAYRQNWREECYSHMTLIRERWTKDLCIAEAQRYSTRKALKKGSPSAYYAIHKNEWQSECYSHMEPRSQPWTKELCIAEAKKHNTISSLQAGSPSVYNAIRNNQWQAECYAHMKSMLKRWTKDSCITEAQRYSTRTEFSKGSRGAYLAACKHGWREECFAHMKLIRQTWTKEQCIAEAQRYSTRNTFREGSSGAYEAARKNNWLVDCYSHMKPVLGGWGIWTKDLCVAEAKKYETRSEFSRCAVGAYSAMRKNGWQEACFAHMKQQARRVEVWTKELCMAEALKYETRFDFNKAVPVAYRIAREKGWLDHICSHMAWTENKCVAEAKKYQTLNEFRNGNYKAYEAAKKNGWLYQCQVSLNGVQTRMRWTKDKFLSAARFYQSRESFAKEHPKAYQKALKEGWLDECEHMISQQSSVLEESDLETPVKTVTPIARKSRNYWTKERCIAAAKEYKTLKDLRTGSPSLYQTFQRNGWLAELSYRNAKPKTTWTKKRCMRDARPFKSRSEFQKNCPSAYLKALKEGWLDDCCSHMGPKKIRQQHTKEECIEVAKKYQYRSEFSANDNNAYHAARKNGWLTECCLHMAQKPSDRVSNRKWTLEMVIEIAKLAGTKRAFRVNYSGAHSAAQKNNWIAECNKYLQGER